MDVFITGSNTANGGFIENNIFEKPWENTGVISNSAYAFHFRTGGAPSPDPNNWDFRYNTFVGPLSIDPGENPVGSGGMRVIGNVFLSGSPCGQGNTTFSYNAFVSGRVRNQHGDEHPRHLSRRLHGHRRSGHLQPQGRQRPADRGNPANYPADDRTGAARYAGAAPDLGAYEGP